MLLTQDVMFSLKQAIEGVRALSAPVRKDPARRRAMLEAIAQSLADAEASIIQVAAGESALAPAELAPEMARMIGTLRMFASLVGEDRWRREAWNPPETSSAAAIGPNHDLRTSLVPLGPVAVFGASNFPLAYGVCGGDTASALAAGCPVVVKEHPAHPKTGRMLLALARAGMKRAGADESWLGYVGNGNVTDLAPAAELVAHPAIKAVGFTGSRRGGMALAEIAGKRPDPIPVFAEMGSTNPVIVTPAAARQRGAQIGRQLAESILMRHGQQCTCPGLIVVPDAARGGSAVLEAMVAAFNTAPPRDMLAPWVRDAYVRRLSEVLGVKDVRLVAGSPDAAGPRGAHAALLVTSADRFAWHPELHDEIFGPAAIVIENPGDRELVEPLEQLPFQPSLTLSVFFRADEAADVALAAVIAEKLEPLAGRIIFNGVPTGVRVAEAMVHGGPFPSSNQPHTTAVGPRAIERWCRPVCWQNRPF